MEEERDLKDIVHKGLIEEDKGLKTQHNMS